MILSAAKVQVSNESRSGLLGYPPKKKKKKPNSTASNRIIKWPIALRNERPFDIEPNELTN